MPVAKSNENVKRVVKLLNTALENLGGGISGLHISEEDVASISAEWTAIKSEHNLKGG